jgi:hypothetical protein
MKSWEITDKTPVGDILAIVESPKSSLMPFGFQDWRNVQEAYRRGATNFIKNMLPYPKDKFQSRGIVTCGGGGYFLCAWVCINILRYHGWKLPIEMWYLDAHEMDPKMIGLMEALGVKCINARELAATTNPCRILNGYELKIFAIKWSGFEEVLFLDADNICNRNPEFLFNLPPYQKLGAIMWKDRRNLPGHVADVFGIEDFHGWEVESGQFLVNKRQCWNELSLAMWYAEHSEFVFKHIHGDKDCFHAGWKRLGKKFVFAPPMRDVHGIFAQPDLEGHELFYHRSNQKWRWEGNNEYWPIDKVAIQIIKGLKKIWPGEAWIDSEMTPEELKLVEEVGGKKYLYHISTRIKILILEADGSLGDRAKRLKWKIDILGSGKKVLSLIDGRQPVSSMVLDEDGIWRGRGFFGNRPFVALVPEGKKLDTKRAFIVVGPESSGVLSMVDFLVKLGAYGNGGTSQPFDGGGFAIIFPQEAASKKTLAVGRTMPHGRNWVDIKDAVEAFRKGGFETTVLVMSRNWQKMQEYQVTRGHVGDVMTADTNILKAYTFVFDSILKSEVDYLIINSESLNDQTYRDWLISSLGFTTTTDYTPGADSE